MSNSNCTTVCINGERVRGDDQGTEKRFVGPTRKVALVSLGASNRWRDPIETVGCLNSDPLTDREWDRVTGGNPDGFIKLRNVRIDYDDPC